MNVKIISHHYYLYRINIVILFINCVRSLSPEVDLFDKVRVEITCEHWIFSKVGVAEKDQF